jgi:FMN-dependent NADH-azoreductase
MQNILLIQSSPRGSNSHSHKIALNIVQELKRRHPTAYLAIRNLARNPLPHIGEDFVTAVALRRDERTPEQQAALTLSDALTDELIVADMLIIAGPMYNFGIASTLKAWIDHIVRAGKTFVYSSTGPQGLLKNKRAILVLASGAVYSEGPFQPLDFQEPHLRTILQFLGITEIEVVRIEGSSITGIGPQKATDTAMLQVNTILKKLEASSNSTHST